MDGFYSGSFGALASVIGKISLAEDSTSAVWFRNMCASIEFDYCYEGAVLLRLAGFVLMLYCNTLMAVYLMKALDKQESVTVTVFSFSANFIVSGLCGILLFGEAVGVRWLLGSLLLGVGVRLILSCQPTQ